MSFLSFKQPVLMHEHGNPRIEVGIDPSPTMKLSGPVIALAHKSVKDMEAISEGLTKKIEENGGPSNPHFSQVENWKTTSAAWRGMEGSVLSGENPRLAEWIELGNKMAQTAFDLAKTLNDPSWVDKAQTIQNDILSVKKLAEDAAKEAIKAAAEAKKVVKETAAKIEKKAGQAVDAIKHGSDSLMTGLKWGGIGILGLLAISALEKIMSRRKST